MSKYVNDVRSTSSDARYMGKPFSGSMRAAIAQAKRAPDYGLPDADLRAPHDMSRDRAALLGFLNLLGTSPLDQARGVPFSILSAEHAQGSGIDNAEATARLRNHLQAAGLKFASATGSYKGTEENAFIVLTPTTVDRLNVMGLAQGFGQESVLHVDSERNAVLAYASGKTESVGRWQSVGDISGLDAWTRDNRGRYYATHKPKSKFSVDYASIRGWL